MHTVDGRMYDTRGTWYTNRTATESVPKEANDCGHEEARQQADLLFGFLYAGLASQAAGRRAAVSGIQRRGANRPYQGQGCAQGDFASGKEQNRGLFAALVRTAGPGPWAGVYGFDETDDDESRYDFDQREEQEEAEKFSRFCWPEICVRITADKYEEAKALATKKHNLHLGNGSKQRSTHRPSAHARQTQLVTRMSCYFQFTGRTSETLHSRWSLPDFPMRKQAAGARTLFYALQRCSQS